MAERKPEVLADLRQMVQLVGRLIVAEPVAAVVGEPQVAGRRIEVEADAVAHAARHDLGPAAREVEPRDRGVERARRRADVARRADRNVELSVRAKRDELPAVMGVGRIGIAGHFGLGRAGEITRDVAEAQDAVHRADVEGAVAKRDAARRVESTGHDEHLVHSIVAVAIHERVHLALGARAHEHDAGRTDRHLAGARHVAGVDGDAEARRQRDLAQRAGGAREHPGEVSAIKAADDDQRRDRNQEQRQDRAGSRHQSSTVNSLRWARRASGAATAGSVCASPTGAAASALPGVRPGRGRWRRGRSPSCGGPARAD